MASIAGGDDEDSNIVSSSFSLVRYNNPVVIEKNDDKALTPASQNVAKAAKAAKDLDSDDVSKRPKSAGDESTSSLAAKQRSETEEILDSILPPREWEQNGQLWRQSVSCTPATRLDVINLQVRFTFFFINYWLLSCVSFTSFKNDSLFLLLWKLFIIGLFLTVFFNIFSKKSKICLNFRIR